MKEIKTINANKFLNKKQNKYIFPIQPLDSDRSGMGLGKIEIHIEVFRENRKKNGLYYINKIWVWFQQTRDKKYYGKIFEIEMLTERLWITADNISGEQTLRFCDGHKNPVIWFYPKNNVTKLEIDASSTIMRTISLI